MDWNGDEKDLERPEDDIDELDHVALYLGDYPDDEPLESLVDLESLVYDKLGASPTSTTVSIDTQASNDMFGLSMSMPEHNGPNPP